MPAQGPVLRGSGRNPPSGVSGRVSPNASSHSSGSFGRSSTTGGSSVGSGASSTGNTRMSGARLTGAELFRRGGQKVVNANRFRGPATTRAAGGARGLSMGIGASMRPESKGGLGSGNSPPPNTSNGPSLIGTTTSNFTDEAMGLTRPSKKQSKEKSERHVLGGGG